MREDTLLAVQPRAFIATTDSQHDLEVYLNLDSRLTFTGLNQLWVADMTYIRLPGEFVYLAVILDGFSRKVVGWALEKTTATRLPLAALHQAITTRHPPPGLVHQIFWSPTPSFMMSWRFNLQEKSRSIVAS
jgi:transposase InsO family protein